MTVASAVNAAPARKPTAQPRMKANVRRISDAPGRVCLPTKFGTATIPPRPFLAPAAVACVPTIAKLGRALVLEQLDPLDFSLEREVIREAIRAIHEVSSLGSDLFESDNARRGD